MAGCYRRWYFHVPPRGMPVIYLCVTILLLLLYYYSLSLLLTTIIMLISLLLLLLSLCTCMKRNAHYHRVERVSSASERIKSVSSVRINYFLSRCRRDQVNYCDVATHRSFPFREIPPSYVTGRRRKRDGYTRRRLRFFCSADFFIFFITYNV